MEDALKAVIIDDERMARVLLEGMLAEHLDYVKVVASCDNLSSGVKAIRKLKPNIVFLDVEMPGHSGLELFDFFDEQEVDFHVIFTTAYNQYAIQAFRLSAVGYLLKPIEADDLVQAVQNYQKLKGQMSVSLLRKNLLPDQDKKIALASLNATRFVSLNDILYFKAVGAYTDVKLSDGKTITVSKGLKKFETILQFQTSFFRCHKSYIVNTKYLTEHVKSDGGYLKLTNEETIPLSSERATELYDLLNRL